MEALRGGLHKVPVFLACAFDTGQCLGIFGLGRFQGLEIGCFGANFGTNQGECMRPCRLSTSWRIGYVPRLPRMASSLSTPMLGKQCALLVTSKVDSGG